MKKQRYTMWAGWGNPKWIGDFLDKQSSDRIEAIWPIIDNETCGQIDGEPIPSQFFCVAFTSEKQKIICDALNASNKADSPDAEQCQTADHIINTVKISCTNCGTPVHPIRPCPKCGG